MPLVSVQRNASPRVGPERVDELSPTTTAPSPDTALAKLRTPPPGNSPKPIIPVTCVQRNAWLLFDELLEPTMTSPSSETALAKLEKVPPGKSPRAVIPLVAAHRNAS